MSAPMPPPVIELEDVHKRFGELVVLDGISLDIPAGQATAIIGPSGTGKSVLLKHIVGLIRPDSGHVRCFGVDMATANERELYAVRRRLGMLFQSGALFDSLSVGENVAFPLVHHARNLRPAQRRARVEEKLALVGLPDTYDRSTSALSGGQRKRVGLARAIVNEPEVVLFDEPNSGLDPITSDAIDELIREMQRALGITFVIISHDIVGTVATADHVAMLHQGHLAAFAPTAEFIRSEDPVVRAFLHRNLPLSAPASGVAPPPHLG